MRRQIAVIALFFVFNVGCVTTPHGSELAQLTRGTSQAHVRETLGDPDHVSFEQGRTQWHYTLWDHTGSVFKVLEFDRGVLVQILEDPERTFRAHELEKIRTEKELAIEEAHASAPRVEVYRTEVHHHQVEIQRPAPIQKKQRAPHLKPGEQRLRPLPRLRPGEERLHPIFDPYE